MGLLYLYRDEILHWYSNFGNLMNTKEHTNDLFLFTNSEKVMNSQLHVSHNSTVTRQPVLIGNESDVEWGGKKHKCGLFTGLKIKFSLLPA